MMWGSKNSDNPNKWANQHYNMSNNVRKFTTSMRKMKDKYIKNLFT